MTQVVKQDRKIHSAATQESVKPLGCSSSVAYLCGIVLGHKATNTKLIQHPPQRYTYFQDIKYREQLVYNFPA